MSVKIAIVKKLDIAAVMTEDLTSAYVGIANKCRCGCAGNYYYRKAAQAEGGRTRGYPVADDGCDDAKVAESLALIRAHAKDAEICEDYASIDVGAHTHTVYFTETFVAAAKTALEA